MTVNQKIGVTITTGVCLTLGTLIVVSPEIGDSVGEATKKIVNSTLDAVVNTFDQATNIVPSLETTSRDVIETLL